MNEKYELLAADVLAKLSVAKLKDWHYMARTMVCGTPLGNEMWKQTLKGLKKKEVSEDLKRKVLDKAIKMIEDELQTRRV